MSITTINEQRMNLMNYTLENVDKIIDTFGCQNRYGRIIKFIVSIITSHCVSKLEEILSGIRNFVVSRFFTKMISDRRLELNSNVITKLDGKNNTGLFYSYGPIYETYEIQSGWYSYEYIKSLDGAMMEKVKSKLKPIIRNYFYDEKLMSIQTTCFETYPRNIYIDLGNLVDNFVQGSLKMSIYKPLNIVLDGEPGTGKTTFCDYLAMNYEKYKLSKINMVNFAMLPSQIYSKCNISIIKDMTEIICFDEIDKSFHNYIGSTENTGRINEYIADLFKLVDGNCTNNSVIFVFCTNNFQYILDNCPEIYKKPLLSRFIVKKVMALNKSELHDFLLYYNDKLNTNSLTNINLINNKINLLTDDYTICARDLHRLFSISLFQLSSVLEQL